MIEVNAEKPVSFEGLAFLINNLLMFSTAKCLPVNQINSSS